LKRTQDNAYSGGTPPLTTEFKSPFLQSRYGGLGIIFGLDPFLRVIQNLRLVGHVDVALLVGKIRSSLDQVNMGQVGNSSNTLRVHKRFSIVPVVDAKAGLNYAYKVNNHFAFDVEAGYQFAGYYRAIDLVFPTLLTGLEQLNNDLRLTGPYLTLGIIF